MTEAKDKRYTIEHREPIAETPELRVQILTIGHGQVIPWHTHTNVTDTYICLDGTTVVATREPEALHELKPGESGTVPPNTPHRVTGKNDGRCRFVIVQGIGKYDYIPAPG